MPTTPRSFTDAGDTQLISVLKFHPFLALILGAAVATITAAGIVSPLAADLSNTHLALLVLAIGAGSVFFSHVNDAGFWLVKEYFGLTIKETILSWSLMETVISVVGLICVLIVSVIV